MVASLPEIADRLSSRREADETPIDIIMYAAIFLGVGDAGPCDDHLFN